MAKLNLTTISDLEGDPSQAMQDINTNFEAIEAQIDLLLSRDGESPNPLIADLDLGEQRLINLGAPQQATDGARVIDVRKLVYALIGEEMPSEPQEDDFYGVSLIDVVGLVEEILGEFPEWQRVDE